MTTPSLYEKIGGEPAIDATVEKFYDFLLQDPILAPFFANTDMKKQRRMQKSFLNHVLGGMPYHGRSMKAAHAKLNLQDIHFDSVLKNMDKAMSSLNVPQELIKEVLAIAETTRNDVLGRE